MLSVRPSGGDQGCSARVRQSDHGGQIFAEASRGRIARMPACPALLMLPAESLTIHTSHWHNSDAAVSICMAGLEPPRGDFLPRRSLRRSKSSLVDDDGHAVGPVARIIEVEVAGLRSRSSIKRRMELVS